MGTHGIAAYNTTSTTVGLYKNYNVSDVIDMEYVNGSLYVLHPQVVKQYQMGEELVAVSEIYQGEC